MHSPRAVVRESTRALSSGRSAALGAITGAAGGLLGAQSQLVVLYSPFAEAALRQALRNHAPLWAYAIVWGAVVLGGVLWVRTGASVGGSAAAREGGGSSAGGAPTPPPGPPDQRAMVVLLGTVVLLTFLPPILLVLLTGEYDATKTVQILVFVCSGVGAGAAYAVYHDRITGPANVASFFGTCLLAPVGIVNVLF